jgi:hypothetical protein
MTENATLTLMVVEPDGDGTPDATGGNLPPDPVELQSLGDKLRFWKIKPRDVDLTALKGQMKKIQSEVDDLLADVKESTGAYHLAEVQVSLAISGSGSIGVATVGAEASIALTFAPSSAA